MRRVVVTGLGIVSSIGNNTAEVVDSLRSGRSGIRFNQEYADLGLRSHVEGAVDVSLEEHIDRRVRRFMGDASAFNYIAMQEAVAVMPSLVSHSRRASFSSEARVQGGSWGSCD